MDSTQKISSEVQKLSEIDLQDESIFKIASELDSMLDSVSTETVVETTSTPAVPIVASKDDLPTMKAHIEELYQAALLPMRNYQRIASILEGMKKVIALAERPQNAEIRPRISAIIPKIAGAFSAVDTIEDLDRPLSEIESAVHKLYGNQRKNSDFYPHRNGKGHQTKS